MRSSDTSLGAHRPSQFVLFEIDNSPPSELEFSVVFALILTAYLLVFSVYLVSFAFLRIEEIENSAVILDHSNDLSEDHTHRL